MNLDLSQIENIASISESLAVVTATILAIWGFNSWRKEARWKRKHELAEEVLANFYDVRERIEIIRSPMGFGGEGMSRTKRDKETEEEARRLDIAYIVVERYKREEEPFINLRKLKYRFIANFGKSYAESFDEISRVINKIIWSYYNYNLREKKGKSGNFDINTSSKEIEELQSIFWRALSGEPDEIKARVDRVVEDIEAVCNKLLSTKQGRKYFNLKKKDKV